MAQQIPSTCKRRLGAETTRIQAEALSIGFYAYPSPNTDNIWDIYIKGSQDSPYDGCILHARMTFPASYPIQPPSMTFVTEIFHPNIYSDGRVCISILHAQDDDPTAYESPDEKWTPVHSICTIVLSVISLLNDPNTASPANVDASKMLNENRARYLLKAREVAVKNAVKWDQIQYDRISKIDQKNIKMLFNKSTD